MEVQKSPCECCSKETEEEKRARIIEVIDQYRDKPGSLIQILHLVQGIYGYLPLEIQ